MRNKRTLKKGINLVCEELFAECLATSLYCSDKSKGNKDALLFSIAKMQAHYLSRVEHPEPGLKAKDYYHDLLEKFSAEVEDIVTQIMNQ